MLDTIFNEHACPPLNPPYAGFGDEFKYALDKDMTLEQAAAAHLRLWNLTDDMGLALGPQPYFHDLSHILYGLALLGPQQTGTMRDKLKNHDYQGNMQVELAVRAIQFMGLARLVYAQNLPSRTALALLMREADNPQALETFAERGQNGMKAAFYIGRHEGRPIFDVRLRHGFDDAALFEKATALSGEPSRPPFPGTPKNQRPLRWYEKINDGDTYWLHDTAQTYRDIIRPSADPDTAVIMANLLPALDAIRTYLQQKAKDGMAVHNHPELIGGFKIRQLVAAMLAPQTGRAPTLDHA